MFYRTIVTILCLLGLVFQVYYISKQYFDYNTVTQVNIEVDEILSPPAVVVCFDLEAILKESQNNTARQIFSAAPSNLTIIDHLGIHSNTSYVIEKVNIDDAAIITRGTRQFIFCYSLKLKNAMNYHRRFITNSFHGSFFLFIIF